MKLLIKWAVQWKMSFKPEPSTHALEIIISIELNTSQHPALIFNNDVCLLNHFTAT